MPFIKSDIKLTQHRDRNLSLKCTIGFSKFEIREKLRCYVTAAVFERDAVADKVLFWTNGKAAWIHSAQPSRNDDTDEFLLRFETRVVVPGEDGVGTIYEYHDWEAVNSYQFADVVDRADDRTAEHRRELPHLRHLDSLAATVHTWNELSPSTWRSNKTSLVIDVNRRHEDHSGHDHLDDL